MTLGRLRILGTSSFWAAVVQTEIATVTVKVGRVVVNELWVCNASHIAARIATALGVISRKRPERS